MPNYVNVYTKREISLTNGVWVDKYGNPVTGIKKSFYRDSVVQDETTLVNGIMNGLQKVYDPTGHLWFENIWKDGCLVSYKYIK